MSQVVLPNIRSRTGEQRAARARHRQLFTWKGVVALILLMPALAATIMWRIPCIRWVQAEGFVMTDVDVEVRCSVEGAVREWLVRSGDLVQKDQVLIKLDDTIQQASYAQAVQDVHTHEASLNEKLSSHALEQARLKEQIIQAERDLSLIKSRYDRMLAANDRGGVYSNKEMESTKLEVERSESRFKELSLSRDPYMDSQIDVIKERIDSAKKNVQLRQAELAMREVHSPITGTIYFNRYEPGEVVKPDHVLGQVFDRNQWVVKLKVNERQLRYVQEGQLVDVDLAAYGAFRNGYLPARVSRITRIVTPRAAGDGFFYIEAEVLDQQKFKLEPGMAARAYVNTGPTNVLMNLIGW